MRHPLPQRRTMAALLLLVVAVLAASVTPVEAGQRRRAARDRSRPSVSISTPVAGATVSGTVTVSGTAWDDVRVRKVEVKVDSGRYTRASGSTSWATSLETVKYADGAHTLTARVTDSSGKTGSFSESVVVSNAPPPAPPPPPPPTGSPYAVRGILEHDSSPTGFDIQASYGFNVMDVGPQRDRLDAVAAAGLKGLVWLGGYENEPVCEFREADDWIRSHVSAIAGHPAIAGYFVDDEPHATECPSAPAQIRARAQLIESLDPGGTTVMSHYRSYEFDDFAGTTDVMVIVSYPCSWPSGCVYNKIADKVAAAEAAGVTRYWGFVQAHGDDYYRQPTPDELHEIFLRWRATAMQGYIVFSWQWPPDDPSLWLESHPDLLATLALENAS